MIIVFDNIFNSVSQDFKRNDDFLFFFLLCLNFLTIKEFFKPVFRIENILFLFRRLFFLLRLWFWLLLFFFVLLFIIILFLFRFIIIRDIIEIDIFFFVFFLLFNSKRYFDFELNRTIFSNPTNSTITKRKFVNARAMFATLIKTFSFITFEIIDGSLTILSCVSLFTLAFIICDTLTLVEVGAVVFTVVIVLTECSCI
jgi:hypothetical protein